jgi:hypothetical protein
MCLKLPFTLFSSSVCVLPFALLKSLILTALLSGHVRGEITITEMQPLKFPRALMNYGQITIVEVNWKGEIANSTNTTLLDDDYYQGRYLITSDSNALISLDMLSLNNEPLLDLKRLRVRYKNKTYTSFPVHGLANPGSRGEFVEIGGKLVANKNISQGPKFPQYLLSVQEQ